MSPRFRATPAVRKGRHEAKRLAGYTPEKQTERDHPQGQANGQDKANLTTHVPEDFVFLNVKALPKLFAAFPIKNNM